MAATLITAIALTGTTAAEAATNPITACVNKKGTARFLTTSGKCKRGERKMQLLRAPGDAGPKGDKGDPGVNGAPGVNGTNGADGSPDTPTQVLDKLRAVDGSASGLDADALDGLDSSAFQRRGTTTSCPAGHVATGWAADGDITCAADGDTAYGAGTGLQLTDSTFSAVFGSTAGTITEGNDPRLSDARTPTGNAGGALTGSYPNPGLDPAAAILNQSASDQSASLRITGEIRTSGLLRTGSNAGTANATPLGGVVIRPMVSSSVTAGSVVARGEGFVVQRDGTEDGLQVVVDDVANTFASVQCTGTTNTGAFIGVSFLGTSGSTTAITAPDSAWTMLHCVAGLPGGSGGSTLMFDLQRYSPAVSTFGGFLISTVNQ